MDTAAFILVACFVFGFGLLSRRLAESPLTPPLAFVGLGVLFGPWGLNWLHLSAEHGVMHVLAELTLILVLFGDAARIDLSALRRELGLPVRLLAIGMPLTIFLGTVAAKWLFPELRWLEAAVLGAVLAPTDAALGQAVVSNPGVPTRVRQALNVESGLNDGIVLPVVLVFAALASMGAEMTRSASEWARFAAIQVTLGPLAGFAVAWVGSKLLKWSTAKEWIQPPFERLTGLALALLAFACAEHVGGNGFIAAFVAGMMLGQWTRGRCAWLYDFLEAEGQLLMLLVFLAFGASFAAPALESASWRTVTYAVLSLTVIRMVPVAIAMLGTGLRPPTVLFLGWFGPRGLASILFGILVLNEADLPHEALIFQLVMLTVLFSVVGHGISAASLARRYAAMAADREHCPEEHRAVMEHPLRARD
ncbi:MAG: sodium:proton antiporter [Deltaproteobacteria bacterium]|nr:sodium:proton antiporter [Deltaproteobacteria bacterium]MBW1875801.1 sodium:proton antiporter [Deltaproteobacteria bacterium]MBW2211411.1 sodium:proton antiporter [Deltaproteobacteria bacterium]MBW2213665.1 sodium:proton antiporter [Deltaproteobacteria bacterium]MBW2550764.1 sodium:proton antiporter [Deltaproteobacteria bacterium]